jgi:hypothetical protein
MLGARSTDKYELFYYSKTRDSFQRPCMKAINFVSKANHRYGESIFMRAIYA